MDMYDNMQDNAAHSYMYVVQWSVSSELHDNEVMILSHWYSCSMTPNKHCSLLSKTSQWILAVLLDVT